LFLSEDLELESDFVLVVVLCQGLEGLLVVEEVFEHPQRAELEVVMLLRRWMASKVDARGT
jgi:hypothetical protein